ncbi:DUF5916 domain-containing protein [Salmonirosea aquatica]|uniref:Hydrolase n=1 Tax=Salmonirosea aquatica TaxID=2654236 RepID=A0A7C9FN79_9BACT|nr:hydrolase [Cytophagaceae bacterium SJW1-29]
MKKIYLFAFISSLTTLNPFGVKAQERYPTPSMQVTPTEVPFTIDGELIETEWGRHLVTDQFWQYFPTDSLKAQHRTEVYMTYDENFLYIAAQCYADGNKFIVPSYRRDYRATGNDNISFVFDTFQDQTNAFLFGMNPFGVMREALISNGGSDTQFFNTYWDNKWQGSAKMYDTYWTCELKIPFKTLRFIDGSTFWNFMCYRFDSQSNEQSTWVRIPQNQLIFNLAFTGKMEFEKPLKKPGANLAFIPYVRVGGAADHLKVPRLRTPLNSVGADLKVGITPGLILDATINPDFSTVEADRQVQNLTRFDISLSFPEQRQFFLENSDLFGTFGSQEPVLSGLGNQNFTPFYSRRVGLEVDTTTGTYTPIRIVSGVRLNGKISKSLRVGLLNIQAARDEERGISDANTTVAVIQKKLFSRSNITAMLVNKEVFNPVVGQDRYNRIAGLEYNLASPDNRWQGKAYYHQAFTPGNLDKKFSTGASLVRNMYRYQVVWNHFYIGEGFEAEVGVVPRRNVFRINPRFLFNFYPGNRFINKQSVGVSYEEYRKLNTGLTDQSIGIIGEITTSRNAVFTWQVANNYTVLLANFDPTRSGNLPLRQGTSYRYTNAQFNYISDRRKLISLEMKGVFGQNFNGVIASLTGAVIYRFQPYGTLNLNYSLSHITTAHGKGNLLLIGPRTDVTFTRSLFWTTFFQYNNLTNNINLNSRIQWRFRPVSDFFLVYSDNYFADSFLVKNRAIIAKLTYWLNL